MSESDVTVRQGTIDDLDALSPLFDAYRQFYGQPPAPERARQFLLERFQRNDASLFIAEDLDRQPLGFAQLFPSFSSVALARTFILNDLFVLPAARRRGIAQRLLGSAVAFCKQSGAVRVSLSTQTTNTAAQNLYATNGWAEQTEYQVYTRKP